MTQRCPQAQIYDKVMLLNQERLTQDPEKVSLLTIFLILLLKNGKDHPKSYGSHRPPFKNANPDPTKKTRRSYSNKKKRPAEQGSIRTLVTHSKKKGVLNTRGVYLFRFGLVCRAWGAGTLCTVLMSGANFRLQHI